MYNIFSDWMTFRLCFSALNVELAYDLPKGFLEPGCDDYEANKRKPDYRCWSKEFFCAAKDVARATVQAYKLKERTTTYLWYLQTPPPGDHEDKNRYYRIQEINWITKMRWNDPRILYWTKSDLKQLGGEMLDRIYFYIETNNINSLELIYNDYNSLGLWTLMKEQCESMSGDRSKMQCKLVVVFDRLAELMIDHRDIPWPDMAATKPPETRGELAMLYLLHPEVYEIMKMASNDRTRSLNNRLRTMFKSIYDNVVSEDGNKMKGHFGKFGSIYANLRTVCAQAYENDFEQLACYLTETFARMELLRSALGPNYDNWQSTRPQSMRAVVLVWLLLTPKFNSYVTLSTKSQTDSAGELLKIMYDKIHGNDLTGLQEIAELVPNEDQMDVTSRDDCSPKFYKISQNLKCGFKILMENVKVFLGQYSSKDQRTKTLDLSVDYKTRLTQFQISSIKGAIENTYLELQSSLEGFTGEIKKYFELSIDNRFSSLRDYFQNVASFDLEIAKADTAFIMGKLNEFKTTAAELQLNLDYDTKALRLEGVIVKSIDATFKWLKAIGSGGFAIVSALTGDFSGFIDAIDRVDDAAKATLEVVKGDAIREQITIATDTFNAIAEGLRKNSVHLENTKNIIDKLEANQINDDEFKILQKRFLQSYNDYTPQVSEAQIAKLDSAWNAVVENLEELIDSVKTVEGIAASTNIFVRNHFFKLKIAVPQLTQTLSNRFDFQFDLMDSLTATVRAYTSMRGANGLTESFKDLDNQLATSQEAQLALKQMALSTYVLSQFHLLLILSQYCNYVTYVNAGVESRQCTNALATMDTNRIDEALSYNPPSCDTVRVDLRIPASDTGRADSINLDLLNSGKPVAFKVPDFDWLKQNGGFSSSDQDSALFVKLFEVYALTNDSFELKDNLRVEVTPAGAAPIYLVSEEVKYELRPRSRTQYIFEYRENLIGKCEEEMNPYHVCSPGPKGICVVSRGQLDDKMEAYPSIYSPWVIKVDNNIGNAPKPAPGTSLFVQARLQLCRKRRDSNVRASRGRKRRLKVLKTRSANARRFRAAQECPVGKYFNQETALFAACTADSTPRRYHYYCEVNPS